MEESSLLVMPNVVNCYLTPSSTHTVNTLVQPDVTEALHKKSHANRMTKAALALKDSGVKA